jgi:hypothetical protein
MLTTTDYHGNPVKIGDYILPYIGYFGAYITEGKKYRVVHTDDGFAYFFDENGNRRACMSQYINRDLTPDGCPPLAYGEASPGDVVFFRKDYIDTKNLHSRNPFVNFNRPYMVVGRSEMSTSNSLDLIRLHDFPDRLYSLGPMGGFYERRFYKKESCKPEEATHVLVLDNSSYERDGLKLGGFYEIAEAKIDFYKNFPETNKRIGTCGVKLNSFLTRSGARPYFQGDRFFFFKKEDAQAEKPTTTIMRPEQQLTLGSDILKKRPHDPKVEVPASLLKLWLEDLKKVQEFTKDVTDDLEVYIKKAEG